MRVFVDSDILIWHLRGDNNAKKLLKTLVVDVDSDLWIGAMQRAEIVFFMKPKEEKQTLDLLSMFKTCPVDKAIIDQAGKYYRKWNPSHGVDPNDAILAAIVSLHGGRIITLNMTHYPMPDIIVHKGF